MALVGAVAIGCSGGNDGTQVRFLVAGEPEELQAFRDVVTAFEDEHPDIDVRLIETGDRDALLARLSSSIAGGEPPDLFLVNYRFFGQFAARDALEPLDERIGGSTVFAEDDFFPAAIEAFRFGGRQLCLPQNLSSLVVYVNEDLFAAAGIEVPRGGWSWDEMVQVASRLTVDEDGDGAPDRYGLGVDPELLRIAPFIWSNDGRLVDDEERPTSFTLSEPESVQAMQLFFDLRSTYEVVPTEEELESEDNESRFLNGRTAMLMESRKVVPSFRTITDFSWDVVPLPVLQERATVLHSDGYCMLASSPVQEEAWAFTEFALGPRGQRIAAATGRTVPSLQSVADSPIFLDPSQPPANSQVFLESVAAIRRVPNISTYPEIEDMANVLLEEAVFEGDPAEEVARAIDRQTRPLFERGEG
ncbi:MAG: sugar ABC transporter substrate-binding protein [Actinomycetota bacterium]